MVNQQKRIAIEWVPLERLTLNPSNPRINDQSVPHVAASIRRFGWRQPIVARPSGEVIAGNTRLKAARELGHSEVPVVWFEGSDLDSTAFGIADNRTHEFSTWDLPSLTDLLQELKKEDALDGVGYASEDLDQLLADLHAHLGTADIDETAAPPPPDAPKTKRGYLYILGRHRLLCGDSGEAEDIDRLLDGAPIHLLNTDPVYNVKVEPRSNNAIAAGLSSFAGARRRQDAAQGSSKAKATGPMRAKDRPLENDYVSDEEFARLLRAWFGNASRALLPGRSFYIWGGYANLANYPTALAENDLYFSQAIVWNKMHPVLTRKDFMGAFELAFYGWKKGASHKYFGPNNASDLWEIKKVNPQAMVHLTEKPVELAVRAIQYSSLFDENVLDLFGGSGSTLIACEQTERNAFLMEIDPAYCDVIVERWQLLTGKRAVLNGAAFEGARSGRV